MQSTVPRLGAGVFAAAMLAILSALTLDRAVSNAIYQISHQFDRYGFEIFGGIFEFLALLIWALVAIVALVVVAMRQGKKGET